MTPSPATRTGIVITMAGAGSRFVQAGYGVPKYEIMARGRTLFDWSLESLRSFIDAGCTFYFVARSGCGAKEFIERRCEKLGIVKYDVTTTDTLTDGQATTALLVEKKWKDPADPIAIYNIDTFVDSRGMDIREVRGAGWIPCFAGEGDKWSFAAADEEGLVSEVREKRRISSHATLGLYWFDSFARFVAVYERYYGGPGKTESNERYVAPLYNQLIEDGARVYIHHVPARLVFPLGTPEDVALFESRAAGCYVSAGAA